MKVFVEMKHLKISENFMSSAQHGLQNTWTEMSDIKQNYQRVNRIKNQTKTKKPLLQWFSLKPYTILKNWKRAC